MWLLNYSMNNDELHDDDDAIHNYANDYYDN